MSSREVTIGKLERSGAVLAIQDGNHGEKHPKVNDYVDEGIPFIMASDLQNNHLDLKSASKLPQDLTDKLRIGFAREGDVLLSHKGSVGYVAKVPAVQPYVMLTPQVTYYRTDDTQLSSDYLCYAFREPLFQKRLANAASSQGTRGYIGIKSQRQLSICFGSRQWQEKLVNILKPYDDLIENNRRRIGLLEEAARLLYREWFVHFRFPGHEHVRMADGLPEGWQRRTLGTLVRLVKDNVKPSSFDEDAVHIGLEHIPRRSFTLSEWEPTLGLASGKVRFHEGDILFAKIRPYFHKVGFAIRNGLASSDALVLRVKEDGEWPLVLCTTSSDHFVAVSSKTVREGSKMPRADWSAMKSYSVPKPPPAILDTFNQSIYAITAQCKALALQNRALAQARDLLLPRLMSGELAV